MRLERGVYLDAFQPASVVFAVVALWLSTLGIIGIDKALRSQRPRRTDDAMAYAVEPGWKTLVALTVFLNIATLPFYFWATRRSLGGLAMGVVGAVVCTGLMLGALLGLGTVRRPMSGGATLATGEPWSPAPVVPATKPMNVKVVIDHDAYMFVHAFLLPTQNAKGRGDPRVVLTSDPDASCRAPTGMNPLRSASMTFFARPCAAVAGPGVAAPRHEMVA